MHYSKQPTKSLARHKFFEAKQSESESIDEFIVRLLELSIDCLYDAAVLKERLREQFINGVRADALKRKLLESEDDDLDDLIKSARTFEQVDRDVRSARISGNISLPTIASGETHFVKHQTKTSSVARNHQPPICFRCGGTRHDASTCLYKEQKWNHCDLLGHKATQCPNRRRNINGQPSPVFRKSFFQTTRTSTLKVNAKVVPVSINSNLRRPVIYATSIQTSTRSTQLAVVPNRHTMS